MVRSELIYFGKPGSFTHLVAKQVAGKPKLVSKGTVQEVIDYVRASKSRRGIVPVENSSSGMIIQTIDVLVDENFGLTIQDEYSINVRLALLAKKGQPIKKIYSHFAPFHHCQKWLKDNYPDAEKVVMDSTSAAAQHAAKEKYSAAIAPMKAAAQYKLDVIHERIGDDPRNLTQFFLLGHERSKSKKAHESSFSVVLKNQVGSLHYFLAPFAKQRINLKRIMSRPIVGQPNNYVFFVGVEGSMHDANMKKAIDLARKHCSEIRVLGSYPVHAPFES